MSEQHLYIKQELENINICPLFIRQNLGQNIIDKNYVKQLLKQKYISVHEMQSISCLFETIFTGNLGVENTPLLGDNVNKWIKNIKMLTSGDYSNILISDIIGVGSGIIKVPNFRTSYENSILEYFIGITKINLLRYYVPTFVYTLGAFQCGDINQGCKGDQKLHIIYENVPGDTLAKNNRSFELFLNIFVQILLSLEVAQREFGFCHYDLHGDNIIIKNEPIKYTVLLDNVSYTISTNEYPVIIDFGKSCVIYKDRNIGREDLEQQNIFPFCIQGSDIRDFLLLTQYYYFSNSVRSQIYFLSEYLNITINNTLTNQTPLNILQKILLHPYYVNILSKTLSIKERDKYISVDYNNIQKIYSNIFKSNPHFNEMIVHKCVNNPSIYSSYILTNIVKNLTAHFYPNKASNLVNKIDKNKSTMIRNDLSLLEGYKKLPIIPSEIIGICNSILQHKVNSMTKFFFSANNRIVFDSDVVEFNKVYKNFAELTHYLDQIYIIRWQGIESEYSDFLQAFKDSKQFKDYISYKDIIIRTYRWIIALENMLKYNGI